MLVWMDLEMTGLDPRRHCIVEIATIVTTSDLEIVEEGPDLVVQATEAQLAEMDDFVTKMHQRSGLLEQIKSSTVGLAEAGEQTLDFVRKHVPTPNAVPLCGNSIGTDRRFLDAYLPDIENHLHYRSIDVSTIKELARRWYPEVAKSVPQKDTSHRALDDIRESIIELRHYRDHFFRLPPATTESNES